MNTEGALSNEEAHGQRFIDWMKRLGVEAAMPITQEELTRLLVARGFETWAAESIAISLEASGRLRASWRELSQASHPRDEVFSVGDTWGALVGIEALIESCVTGSTERTPHWQQQVAALLTSVIALDGALAQLATRRQSRPPSPTLVATETLKAAEQTLLTR